MSIPMFIVMNIPMGTLNTPTNIHIPTATNMFTSTFMNTNTAGIPMYTTMNILASMGLMITNILPMKPRFTTINTN